MSPAKPATDPGTGSMAAMGQTRQCPDRANDLRFRRKRRACGIGPATASQRAQGTGSSETSRTQGAGRRNPAQPLWDLALN